MKQATLRALTSMPFGRPVEPDVKMRYCVSSPVTQRLRSGARIVPGADAIARTSTMRPAGTRPRSASGSGTVAAKSGAPSWDTMSMRRAAGISVSTGTNACPLFKQPRKPATMSGALCPRPRPARGRPFARPAPRRWRPTASTTPRTPSSSRRPRGRQAPADATAPPPQPIAGIRSPLPSTTAPSLSSWLQPGCVPQAGGSKIGPDYGSAVTATDS